MKQIPVNNIYWIIWNTSALNDRKVKRQNNGPNKTNGYVHINLPPPPGT